MDGLMGLPRVEHYDYKPGSTFKGYNSNSHWYQWPPPGKCSDNWYQEDSYSLANEGRLSRGIALPSSHSDSQLLGEEPSDDEEDVEDDDEEEEDEEDFQENRQNNSCQCSVCCDAGLDLEQFCGNKKSSRRETNQQRQCGDSFSETDSSIPRDLGQIFDKIFKVAKWGAQRRGYTGLRGPKEDEEYDEGPPVLFLQKEPPHTRHLVRVKSFKRHQMYQRLWKVQPAIGENFRFSLRQKVRKKMLKKDEVQLPHKVFVPNLYVVPTVKPRYNLRWAVRKCNHDYRMPPVGFFPDLSDE